MKKRKQRKLISTALLLMLVLGVGGISKAYNSYVSVNVSNQSGYTSSDACSYAVKKDDAVKVFYVRLNTISQNSGMYITSYRAYDINNLDISSQYRVSATNYYNYSSLGNKKSWGYTQYVDRNDWCFTYYLPDSHKVNVTATGYYCP